MSLQTLCVRAIMGHLAWFEERAAAPPAAGVTLATLPARAQAQILEVVIERKGGGRGGEEDEEEKKNKKK